MSKIIGHFWFGKIIVNLQRINSLKYLDYKNMIFNLKNQI